MRRFTLDWIFRNSLLRIFLRFFYLKVFIRTIRNSLENPRNVGKHYFRWSRLSQFGNSIILDIFGRKVENSLDQYHRGKLKTLYLGTIIKKNHLLQFTNESRFSALNISKLIAQHRIQKLPYLNFVKERTLSSEKPFFTLRNKLLLALKINLLVVKDKNWVEIFRDYIKPE